MDSGEKLHFVSGFCRNDVRKLSRYEITNLEKRLLCSLCLTSIAFKKMFLAALSVGDIRKSMISSLYPCQKHFLEGYIYKLNWIKIMAWTKKTTTMELTKSMTSFSGMCTADRPMPPDFSEVF